MKKTKKKQAWLIGAVALSLTLFGCSDNGNDELLEGPDNNNNQEVVNNSPDNNAETDEPAETTGLSPDEILNTAFKEHYPAQYDSYFNNLTPSENPSKFDLSVEPNLPMLFNNYGFMLEYNHTRGHTYALEDVLNIARISDVSIGSCMTCKSTAVPDLIDEMGDDYWGANFRDEIVPRTIELGAEGEGSELGDYGHISVGCSDCHDPATMELRITRPSFTEAMDRQGIDVSEASNDDMKSYVCAQCHVEYYFEPEHQQVTFPWDNGTTPEEMFDYFEDQAKDAGFDYDWLHSVSGAPMLKVQHPEFEVWQHGIHAQMNVSCADCHMPAVEHNGEQISNHRWQSPLNHDDHMESACLSCHNVNPDELRERVHDLQDTFHEQMETAQWDSVRAHYYVNRMITAGADEEAIEEAQFYIRKGQWFWDFMAAENSDGFHNMEGAEEALETSIEASNEALDIATEQLTALGEDIDELENQIEETMQTVYEEDNPYEKHKHPINEYFPNVLELD